MVHAFHPYHEKLVEFNTKLSIENLKLNQTTKIKLFIKQKGKCGICNLTLLSLNGEYMYDGTTQIHHKELRSEGGSKNSMANMTLVHSECHMDHQK